MRSPKIIYLFISDAVLEMYKYWDTGQYIMDWKPAAYQ